MTNKEFENLLSRSSLVGINGKAIVVMTPQDLIQEELTMLTVGLLEERKPDILDIYKEKVRGKSEKQELCRFISNLIMELGAGRLEAQKL